jgi:hypothetical protein
MSVRTRAGFSVAAGLVAAMAPLTLAARFVDAAGNVPVAFDCLALYSGFTAEPV